MDDQELQMALENLREAIQQAENFGLVRTEDGKAITVAVATDDGIMLTE